MAPGNGESHLPAKRRKVAESCKACRAKKTRCDGLHPQCSSCIKKGILCQYNDTHVAISTSTLLDIKARLQKLEDIEARMQKLEQADAFSTQIPSRTTRQSIRQPHLNPDAEDVGSGSEAPFADHSTTQFIQDMTQIADFQSNGQITHASTLDKNNGCPVEADTLSMVVPERAVADDLLECYEKFVYPLFPILHMPTFRDRYNSLWDRQRQGHLDSQAAEATFHAALNMVFALGCLHSSHIERPVKKKKSKCFYKRARLIMPQDSLDTPSLATVQYLLLTTNYLSFTAYFHRCINTLAVAIRVAQTLGLHMDVNSSSSNQFEEEMGRRIWYHCLTLERLFSSILGRKPLAEPENTASLPNTIDDEYLLKEGRGIQPVGVPSILDAFIVTIKIFEIIEEARKVNYGFLTRILTLDELIEALRLNEKINQIENNLPSYLKYYRNEKPQTPRQQALRLQAESLRTRILHVRLVLLRPNILATARQSLLRIEPELTPSCTETSFQVILQTEVSKLCIQAALSAITMLHENLDSCLRIISPNAVYITLSSAAVIVAASLIPELGVNLENSSGPHGIAIERAFQVLDEHQWQVGGALRAKEQLRDFIETLNREKRLKNAANQVFTEYPQNEAAQLEMGDDTSEFGFIDASNPLWTCQWGELPEFNFI